VTQDTENLTDPRPQPPSEIEELKAELDRLVLQKQLLSEELASQRETLKAIFDLSTDALLVLDISGAILSANGMAATWLKIPLDQLAGRNLLELLPNESEARHWMNEAILSKRPLSYKSERDGKVFGHKIEPFLDPRTRVFRLAFLTRDITTTKRPSWP